MERRKLALAALGFSAAIFGANYLFQQQILPYISVISALLATALAITGRKWLRTAVIFSLSFAVGIMAYQLNYERTVGRTLNFDGQIHQVYAELVDYPREYEDYCRLEVQVLNEDLPRLRAIVYDNDKSCAGLSPGARISFIGTVKRANTVFGENYDHYYSQGIYLKISARGAINVEQEQGRGYFILRLSRSLDHNIKEIFPDDTSHFMQAMLLGDKTDLYEDEGLHLALTRAGFMHIVAVSGMHVAFLVGLLRCVLGAGRRCSLLCMLLVWLFVLVTGASPSAVRAGFMQSILLLAPLLRRENDSPTSLSLALALILLQNPFAAASVSLQLSFAAVAGLFCFSGRIYRFIASKLPAAAAGRAGKYILANTAASLGVMVFTTPLTAIHFGYIPVLAVLSNVAGLWAVSLCFGLGWAACALAFIPELGHAAAWLCSWLARYIFLVAELVSELPVAVLYLENTLLAPWMLGCYGLFFLFALLGKSLWLRLVLPGVLSLSSLCLVLCYVNYEYNSGRETLAVVDVGQGLCAVALGRESTVVVDCGGINSLEDAGELGGKYLISRGRNKIDSLIITSLEEEHAGGVPMLMEMVEIEHLYLPVSREKSSPLLEKILDRAWEREIQVEFLKADSSLDAGGIGLDIFLSSKGQSSSLWVLLDMGGYRALIPGDGARQAENSLKHREDIQSAKLLIIDGEASAESCTEGFLRSLDCSTAIMSADIGKQDSQAEESLERLELCGYNVYRTDIDGTIELRLTG